MVREKSIPQLEGRSETALKDLVQLEIRTSTKAAAEAMTADKAKGMYQTMENIRNFEDNVRRFFAQGLIPGFVHLYAGEEAVATGVCY